MINGGVVFGLITVVSGGQVVAASGGKAFDTVVSGGTLTVASGGTVSSTWTRGLRRGARPKTVVNSGSIAGTGATADGIALAARGSVTKAALASISGGFDGVAVSGGARTVVNSGRN